MSVVAAAAASTPSGTGRARLDRLERACEYERVMRKRVVSPDAAPRPATRADPAGAFTCFFPRPAQIEPGASSPAFRAAPSGPSGMSHAFACAILVLLVTLGLLTALNIAPVSPAVAADAIRSADGRKIILAQGRGRLGPPRRGCLSRREQRERIATKAVVPLSKLARAVKARGGELLRARLCRRNGRLVYLLTVLGPGGKVRRPAVDARTGAVIR